MLIEQQAVALMIGDAIVTPHGRVGVVTEIRGVRSGTADFCIHAWTQHGADGPYEGPWNWRDLRHATREEAERFEIIHTGARVVD